MLDAVYRSHVFLALLATLVWGCASGGDIPTARRDADATRDAADGEAADAESRDAAR